MRSFQRLFLVSGGVDGAEIRIGFAADLTFAAILSCCYLIRTMNRKKGSNKTDPYLGAMNASGDEEKSVGKLRVRSFQRFFLVVRFVDGAEIRIDFFRDVILSEP